MNVLDFFKQKIIVTTHNGSFHADDVFAVATLSLWAEMEGRRLKVIRTRDEKIIEEADMVVDVGMQYDPERNRFDHHQNGGAGKHQNGILHASFGLVWKKFGEKICGSDKIARMIEQKLVTPIDAIDNGINTSKSLMEDVPEYRVSKELIYAFRPTWQEPSSQNNKKFFEFMDFAKNLISNEIRVCKAIVLGEEKVQKAIDAQKEPEILILEEDLPWDQLVTQIPKIKVVVYPELDTLSWCAEIARDNLNDYKSNRASFPKEWAGFRDDELIKISGIKGAIFCHKGGWFVVCKSREGAIRMAKIALDQTQT